MLISSGARLNIHWTKASCSISDYIATTHTASVIRYFQRITLRNSYYRKKRPIIRSGVEASCKLVELVECRNIPFQCFSLFRLLAFLFSINVAMLEQLSRFSLIFFFFDFLSSCLASGSVYIICFCYSLILIQYPTQIS